ncbi:hypothetical protein PDESU_04408 [Pontiella desulfatans]|uniref:DUF3352 domain-containing protein n=1 Tax=Pontiella desulfatans TaxID=2750659 RepID=A0A6C2U8J1_PONDE|nr:hypothetical protein [Pontiella desulfatans]VGO15821.1 hypothetical protein PDESU_04408 [Pontiella desulfatans]
MPSKTLSIFLLAALPLAALPMERTELLPPEAQTYVRVSNTTNFWSMLKKSSIGKLWQDQQFQDFMGNPDADTWQEFIFDGEKDAEDEVFLEQLKMLNGEIILAFDLNSEDPYIIAMMGKEEFEKSLVLDDQVRDVMKEPFDIVRSSFQDVEIVQHVEKPGTGNESFSWQAHVGSTFVMGHTREWVEQCIVRLRKDEVVEPSGNPVLNINLPLARMIEDSITEGQPGVSERAMFEALGLLDIENFSSTIELRNDRLVADNILRIGAMGKGLFTILDVQPSELPTVTFIPEDIASIEVGRFNLLGLWQEIPNVLASADPAMKPQFDMLLAMIQQQAGINLEQDLLAHLGKKFVSFATVEGEKSDSVVAVDLVDGAAFKKGLETALAAPAMQPYVSVGLEIDDFLDHTIYTLKESDPAEAMGISIAGDYLLYGTPGGLRQVIRSVTSDAAANQAFERTELVKGLREHVPPRAFAYSAIDWKKSMDVILEEIAQPGYVSMIRQRWAMSGSALPPPDFDKLPPADHIASYFNVSYQYVEASVHGLHQKIILKY